MQHTMLILLIGIMTLIIVLSATKWNCAALIERRLSVTILTSVRILVCPKNGHLLSDIFVAGAENRSLASAALTGHIWCMVKLHIHSSLYALQFSRLLPSIHNQLSCSDTSHKVPLPHMQSLATAG